MFRKLLIRIGSIVVAGAVVQMGTSDKSMALDLDFSFTNANGNTSGTVTGVIKGLTANESSGVPTDVEITSYPTGLNNGAVQALPSATVQQPWDIYNDPAYYVFGHFSTDAEGDITGGSLEIESPNNVFQLGVTYAELAVATQNGQNQVSASGITTSPAAQVVPWSDPCGGSLPAIGAVLGIGVMRKAKQFQKAKVGSSQLEKV